MNEIHRKQVQLHLNTLIVFKRFLHTVDVSKYLCIYVWK